MSNADESYGEYLTRIAEMNVPEPNNLPGSYYEVGPAVNRMLPWEEGWYHEPKILGSLATPDALTVKDE